MNSYGALVGHFKLKLPKQRHQRQNHPASQQAKRKANPNIVPKTILSRALHHKIGLITELRNKRGKGRKHYRDSVR